MSDSSPGNGDTFPAMAQPATGADPVEALAEARLRAALFDLPEEPVKVGRFSVLAKLGSGGMGVVYRCYDPQLRREVAVKLLHPRGADDSTRGRQRMLREAQTMARLSHPNVVQVFEVGEHADGIFVAMELIEGRTLAAWAADAERSVREIVAVFLAVGRGLAAAHGAGVVHRDLKPANIMIDAGGVARVMDFGIARGAATGAGEDGFEESTSPEGTEHDDTSLTKTGDVKGTPAYMAPEQFEGRGAAASDQFSYCVSLFEAIHGARPFAEGSWAELVGKSTRIDPPTNRAPGWLRDVIERGLHHDPQGRYPDMEALLADLGGGERQAQRRRRWLGVGVVATLAVLALGVSRWQAYRADLACLEEATAVQSVWNPRAKDMLAEAITDADVPYGHKTLQRVSEALDRQTDAWTDTMLRVCRSARVDGEVSTEAFARTRTCLDERLIEMSVLLDEIGHHQEAIEHAAITASELTAPVRCADSRRDARFEESAASALGDVSGNREVRVGLLRAQTQLSIGRHEAGYESALGALKSANASGHDVDRAAALVQLGSAEEKLGRFQQAAETLQRAYFESLSARAMETAAEASALSTFVTGYHLNRFEEAELWGRLAEAALDDVAAPDSDLRRARLAGYRGALNAERGNIIEAVKMRQLAVDIAIEQLGDKHPIVGIHLGNLAASKASDEQYDDALRLHERGRAIMLETVGELHPVLGDMLLSEASLERARGRVEKARDAATRALDVYDAALGQGHPRSVRALLNLAVYETALGEVELAHEHVRRGIDAAERSVGAVHFSTGALYNALGSIQIAEGNYTAALDSMQRALRVFEQTGPDSTLADSLENVAAVHEELGNLDDAASLRARASDLRQTFGREQPKK